MERSLVPPKLAAAGEREIRADGRDVPVRLVEPLDLLLVEDPDPDQHVEPVDQDQAGQVSANDSTLTCSGKIS